MYLLRGVAEKPPDPKIINFPGFCRLSETSTKIDTTCLQNEINVALAFSVSLRGFANIYPEISEYTRSSHIT